MRITFLGNFDVPYTSESHYLRTLQALGHEVIPLREAKTSASDILKEAVKSDLFFWVHTHGWHTQGIAEVLEILKEKGIPTVGYHLDLWLGIAREKDLETDPYWGIQYFFSVDPLMVDLLNNTPGMPKAFFLRAGVFEDECYISKKERPEFKYDVIFVGSRGYHPEWPYRKDLIEWLERTYGTRFAQYGGGGRGTIRGNDLNDLYKNAKVVVCDTLCKGFVYPQYLSDRVFETTGRGGFAIHPYIKGIEEAFKLPTPLTLSGEYYNTKEAELITYPFGNFEYLKYLIDYFVKNESEREAIRLRGHQRTKRDHTYTQRLSYLLETIENEKNNNQSEMGTITA